MPHVETDVDTKLSADRVIAALTDFTERRPDIWSGLNRDTYEVYELGDTWAEVREGTGKNIWARERYDWSTPGTVKWTVVDSPFSSTGDSVTVNVSASGSGSRVHVAWDRTGKTVPAKVMLGVLSLFMGTIIKRYWKKTLDGIAATTNPNSA